MRLRERLSFKTGLLTQRGTTEFCLGDEIMLISYTFVFRVRVTINLCTALVLVVISMVFFMMILL